uniref:Vpu protein n=1 Tax=Human immunodeficiency virus type 1 TaxID=11676 RepID=A0A0A0URR8_HV1|nr:vpu protein [Human immunodeficiency virus 1]
MGWFILHFEYENCYYHYSYNYLCGPSYLLKYEIVKTQKKILGFSKNFGERTKHCGNESVGETEEISPLGGMGRLMRLDANMV